MAEQWPNCAKESWSCWMVVRSSGYSWSSSPKTRISLLEFSEFWSKLYLCPVILRLRTKVCVMRMMVWHRCKASRLLMAMSVVSIAIAQLRCCLG